MLRQLVFLTFLALCVSFAITEAHVAIKSINPESDVVEEGPDDLKAAASAWSISSPRGESIGDGGYNSGRINYGRGLGYGQQGGSWTGGQSGGGYGEAGLGGGHWG